MRADNILQNYDEFYCSQDFQNLDMNNIHAVEEFKDRYYLTDDDLEKMQIIKIPSKRTVQDYRFTYNDIQDWLSREQSNNEKIETTLDCDAIVFEVDLLKSLEIYLDYILELILNIIKSVKDTPVLVEEVCRLIRASLGNRAKESLVLDFINQNDLDQISDKATIIDAFFQFAQVKQKREAEELTISKKLTEQAAKRYITTFSKREYASQNGIALNDILSKISSLNPQYLIKKQTIFQKTSGFVEKFKGVGVKN